MKKLLTATALVGLVMIAGAFMGCGKIGGGGGADNDETMEMIMDLQDQIELLEDDVEALSTSLTELQDEYDEHIEEMHKEEPKPKTPIQPKSGGGGGGVKPPTTK